ncbi:EAL domain-containing protein [Photobacterium angustum]|uniref:EAL domain-containing protein n=1 Tax=Photobacterium angustum TaxID=661 RepID=A0A855SE91_PHOAN|nr:EAL domain-containing protein [Photobacterium angustum]KJF83228.1 diguanylate phosphodiesterase [Photobacterium damselae subsp. damselae]KJG29110.1 diguanylate phosphodiesterase [Photobacterium angustum]KJG42929.1 diguanylate phosphodiesterase [Photobacterium angustum]KJG47536.1 diguanylate phosphodiesterase [Photobacterium angustum]KJG49219.1 diguanylate phosphodiesterase [Photobacterium angustum]
MFKKERLTKTINDIFLMRFSGHIGIGLMFFVILVGFGFTTLAPYFATKQLSTKIQTDTDELVQTHIKNILDYQKFILNLGRNFDFTCSEKEQEQLRRIAYSNYLIRKISLTPSGKSTCSSFYEKNHEQHVESRKIKNYSNMMSLWLSSERNSLQHIFEVHWQGEKGSLVLSLEPIVEEILRNKYCEGCVLTSISADNEINRLGWQGDNKSYTDKPIYEVLMPNGLKFSNYIKLELLEKESQLLRMPLFLAGAFIAGFLILLRRLLIRRRLSLHALVQRGIVKREFIPYYQPIINLKTKELYGCEVLARWKKKGVGLISPMEFIPYVEKSGQIIPITNLLIEKTIKDLSTINWQLTDRVISINLVPQQLENLQIMNESLALFSNSKIPVKQVAFEITERKQFEDLTIASEVIQYLKAQGIDIKLDDAGTGYGGFSYIQELNLRSLKIDKMFVENIGTTDIKLSLLDSIIAFGKQAGMEMIAEGVETKEQSDYLVERDVYLQQGYYFGMPMNAEEFSIYNIEIKNKNKLLAI